MAIPYPLPVFAVGFAVVLCACSGGLRLSPYRIDVRQGNMVTQDMVAKLKLGMTEEQVRFVLGTPLIADIFHTGRWDYVYRFAPGGRGEVVERKLAVFFADGKLARVAGDVIAMPGGEADASAESSAAQAPDSGVPKAVELAPADKATAPPQE